MQKTTLILASAFVVFHLAIIAPFVPVSIGAAPWALMMVVSVVGLVGWGQTLLRKAMPSTRVTVSKVERFEGGVDVTFACEIPLPAYRPGQFATLARDGARSEAHPFTIAGGDQWSRRFVIRAAGDWTDDVVRNMEQGDTFRIGGGYWRFLPRVQAKRTEQLWVAGGVGITPFLAAMEAMEPDEGARVSLIYCIRSRASAGALAAVEAHAARLPQLGLIVVNQADGERLIAAQMADIVRAMDKEAQAYLCGPEGLKQLVKMAWQNQNMHGRVHSEAFDFRGALGLSELVYVGKPVVEMARNWTQARATHATAGS